MKETVKLAYDIGQLYSHEFYQHLVYTATLDFGFWIPVITLLCVLLVGVSYYYFIDRPKTSKLKIWLLFLGGTGLIGGIFAYIKANNSIINYYYEQGLPTPPDFTSDITIFASIHFLYTMIAFFIFSICIKWWSTNSSHVPF